MMKVSTTEVKVKKGEGAAALAQMAELLGPGQADQMLRQAMQLCWMAVPSTAATPRSSSGKSVASWIAP